jgi:UDP-N-acetylglucosamine:LPS N-acetylglucosamine transferase
MTTVASSVLHLEDVLAEDRLAIFGCRPGRPARTVLAISSGGGHWAELVRLHPALDGHRVTWVTTGDDYRDAAPPGAFRSIRDASMWDKAGLLVMAAQVARIAFELRPDVVVTTGAAPGYLAIRLGNLLGATTVWLDSIANAEELSLSGRRARGHADLHLTQWEHLVAVGGPSFAGSVL